MPPRDPRLCPALERAHPADDKGATGWRRVDEPRTILFGDGGWHQVQVIAEWIDREGRRVIQMEWSAANELWGETYRFAEERIREV